MATIHQQLSDGYSRCGNALPGDQTTNDEPSTCFPCIAAFEEYHGLPVKATGLEVKNVNKQELQEAIAKQTADWQRICRTGNQGARSRAFAKLRELEKQLDDLERLNDITSAEMRRQECPHRLANRDGTCPNCGAVESNV